MSETPGRRIIVPLTATPQGGASEGADGDYTLSGNPVTFEADDSGADLTESITITANNDMVDDDGETILLTFGELPSNVEASGNQVATVNIVDNDGLEVSFGSDSYTATERGAPAIVEIRLSVTPTTAITIPITATPGNRAITGDYSITGFDNDSAANKTVTFAAGAGGSDLAKSITITATDDMVDDEGETLLLAFGTLPANVTVSGNQTATVNIADNDELEVSFGSNSYTATEGGATAKVAISLNLTPTEDITIPIGVRSPEGASEGVGGDYSIIGFDDDDADDKTITFAANARGDDLTKSITITAADDAVNDDGETIILTFGALPSEVTTGTLSTTTVNLSDSNELIVRFGQGSYRAAEGGAVTVTIQLSVIPTTAIAIPITVVEGSGVTSGDYSITGFDNDRATNKTITFAANSNVAGLTKSIRVTAADDSLFVEGDETLLTLGFGTPPTGVTVGDPRMTTITIVDNDPVTVSFGAGPYVAVEGGTTATVEISLSNIPQTDVTIPIRATAVAPATDSDYGLNPTSVIFLAGTTALTQSVTVTATNDSDDDDGGSVRLSFGVLPTGVILGIASTATVTLDEDDDRDTIANSLDNCSQVVNPGQENEFTPDDGKGDACSLSSSKIASGTANGPALSDGDWFGDSVASLGDLDGTGGAATVLAVGATRDDAGGINRGALHLLYLNSNSTVRKTVEINDDTANGPALSDNDRFGRSVANLGDLDGSGGAATVLAVGATGDNGDDGGNTDLGAVHLLYLNSNGTVRDTVEINDNTTNGPALSKQDNFGISVANLGDLDGSGGAATVLAVGATGDDAGGTPLIANRGAVHLLYLNSNGTVQKTVEINDNTTNGPALSDNDSFGNSVANLGDLDGSGGAAAVLAVGADGDDAGGNARGAVHLLYLNSNGTVQKTIEINGNTTNGPALSNSDNFGSSVTNLGDLDGSGGTATVLAVGAIWDDAGSTGNNDRGAVHLLRLNSNGTVQKTVEINDTTAGGPILGNDNWFGSSVASLGDLDGSGPLRAILAVGATGDDTGGSNRGAVHLLFIE